MAYDREERNRLTQIDLDEAHSAFPNEVVETLYGPLQARLRDVEERLETRIPLPPMPILGKPITRTISNLEAIK